MLSICSMQTNTRAHMQLMHAQTVRKFMKCVEKCIMCCMSHAVDIMTRHTEGDRVDLQLTPWVETGNMLA